MAENESRNSDGYSKFEPRLIQCIQNGSMEDARILADEISEEYRDQNGWAGVYEVNLLKRMVERFVDPRVSGTIRITLTAETSQFFEYLDHPVKIFNILLFKYLMAIQQCVRKQSNSQNYELVIKAIDAVEKGYMDSDFSLEKVATGLYVSYGHLCSIFRKFTGVRFKDYLIEFRMKKACELLKNGQYEVQRVAELTGYSSSRYFNTAFHKSLGMSPSAYSHMNGSV